LGEIVDPAGKNGFEVPVTAPSDRRSRIIARIREPDG
jgi:hypothetical protein